MSQDKRRNSFALVATALFRAREVEAWGWVENLLKVTQIRETGAQAFCFRGPAPNALLVSCRGLRRSNQRVWAPPPMTMLPEDLWGCGVGCKASERKLCRGCGHQQDVSHAKSRGTWRIRKSLVGCGIIVPDGACWDLSGQRVE